MQNNIKSNSPSVSSSQSNGDTIHLRDLLFKYIQKWYWFVLVVIICLILATLFIRKTETKYKIQTTILLRNDNTTPGISQMAMMESLGFNGVSKEVEDEIQVISSKKILKQAIDSLGLQIEYFEKDGLKYVEKYRDFPFTLNISKEILGTINQPLVFHVKESLGKYKLDMKYGHNFKEKYKLDNIQQTFETPLGKIGFISKNALEEGAKYKIVVYPINQLLEKNGGKISVSTVNKQSNAIQISTVESNIPKAQDYLNKIVELYNLDAIVDKNIIATNTANFINDQLDIISKNLFKWETSVEGYKRSQSLTDLSSEATLYLESASEYEKKLTELGTQLNMIQSVENYIKNPKNSGNLIPANVVTEDPALAKSIQEYNMAVLERMKLAQTAKEKNPSLIQADQQIDALRANVLASVNSVKNGLQIAKNDVLKKDAQFNTRIKNVPTQERQFLEIKREQEITQNLYIFLSQKKLENALSLASTAPAARTIDRAYASLDPVAPKRMTIYLVAIMLGVLIPFLVIYLKDLINNKIEDSKEFQNLVKPPYLGNVAVSRESERVVVREGKTTPIVEMFRLIRTNLQFLIGSKKSPVILITSSISGEGKSFTSINIAMSLALMKKKVVLIGMDIRNPMLGEYMHIPKDKGVTLFITNTSYSINDVIEKSGFHPLLDVIPAGPIPPNPSELLMSNRVDELIEELKKIYDYIIVDTAPIGVVSDTYLLNRIADNCIYVARQDYTPKDAADLINEIYKENRLNGMGVILNGTPVSSGYGYSYGYGSKYKSSNAPKITFGDRLSDFIDKLTKKN